MDAETPPLSDAELDTLFKAAGLAVPADLKAGTYAEARKLKAATALLRGPRPAAAEPSNTFSLVRGRR